MTTSSSLWRCDKSADCRACHRSTIVAIARQKVNILDGLQTMLRPALDKELYVIFGQAGS